MGGISKLIPLAGSELPAIAAGFEIGRAKADRVIEISVWLRRNPAAPALPDIDGKKALAPMDRATFAGTWGASADDIAEVEKYLAERDASIVRLPDSKDYPDIARRLVGFRGKVSAFELAFDVKLSDVAIGPGARALQRTGAVKIPAPLQGKVLGVFGLDTRPIGINGGPQPRDDYLKSAASLPNPVQIADLYGFPSVSSAAGQTIALMEFGGGYLQSDIDAYFANILGGAPAPTLDPVGIAGASNAPGSDYDKEVTLNIQIAGAVAARSTLAVYFAPHTERGWVEAIASAVHDVRRRPGIMSISWGAPELLRSNTLTWTSAGISAMSQSFVDAACLGMTVLAAAGNDGSNCHVNDRTAHVSYPASDPHVLACGGTAIADFVGNPANEIAWRYGGGGVSDFFTTIPAYQQGLALPMSRNTMRTARTVPDIAGYADPGFKFYVGGEVVLAGTSLVAPLYAGAVARLNAANGNTAGFFHRALYTFPALHRDIDDPVGNNTPNSVNWSPGYYGRRGYDARTGLGIFTP